MNPSNPVHLNYSELVEDVLIVFIINFNFSV